MSDLSDALIDSQLSLVVTIVKSTVKNEKSKARFRLVLLRIFRAIRAGFAGDPDFE